jgi:hypothetical protein
MSGRNTNVLLAHQRGKYMIGCHQCPQFRRSTALNSDTRRDIQHNLTILSPLEITEDSYCSRASKRREDAVALIALQLVGALF